MTHDPRQSDAVFAGGGVGPLSRTGEGQGEGRELPGRGTRSTRVDAVLCPEASRPSPQPSPARERARVAPASIAPLLAACALGALAAGCNSQPVATTGAIEVSDYRARHPIVLTDGTRSLDVFPTGVGHLDPRQTADVDAFMLEYRRYGRGTLLMEVPRGGPPAQAASAERTAAVLTRLAAQDRVGPREIAVTGYAVAAPSLAAPIRLSFQRMQAKVSDACGLWPNDTGTSNFALDYNNRPMWNLGCATQSTVAAQVADPVDLVRGRPEGRIDTVKRVRDIGQLRDGKDPSTTWRQDGQTDVKSQVAQ